MPSLAFHLNRLLLSQVNLWGLPETPIPEQRQRINKLARRIPKPRRVAIEPVEAGGAPAEWLLPRDAPRDRALLYFHGGGFCICSLDTHRPLVAALAKAAGMPALSLDYRMAPEHPFPAALEDCLSAYRWLLSSGIPADKIALGGDSAGGNLALATLLALRQAGDPLPAAAVLLSPVTDLAGEPESRRSNAAVDLLLHEGPVHMVAAYISDHDPSDPLISPLFADLHGLPPLLFHVGSDEILLDDSTCFVEKARQAGVDAQVEVWPGMWHVFQATPSMPEARRSIEALGAFIRQRME
jgi:monoterpene epsilon-lactone hydrolase